MTNEKKWNVILEKRAEKEFSKLPENIRLRFYKIFELLEDNPYIPRPGCDIRILADSGGARAVRVGEYRGIYQIIEEAQEVRFTIFAHRRHVYK